jgi:tetraacyldisaccharide-1-P 4'-kinase
MEVAIATPEASPRPEIRATQSRSSSPMGTRWRAAGGTKPYVVVLEVGFQHRRIARTKDILLIDAGQSPFDTMLLPAGYRRELTGSVKRAQAVLFTKTKSVEIASSMMLDERFGSVEHKFSSSFKLTPAISSISYLVSPSDSS